MRDDNAARDAVVKAHLKDADVVIICSNIKRGADPCCMLLFRGASMDLTRVLHCTHAMALAPQWQRSTLCACTAVNDQLAKKMFGEAMRRQLLMDGKLGDLMCTLLLPCQLFVRFFCDCCCHELPAATRLLQ